MPIISSTILTFFPDNLVRVFTPKMPKKSIIPQIAHFPTSNCAYNTGHLIDFFAAQKVNFPQISPIIQGT